MTVDTSPSAASQIQPSPSKPALSVPDARPATPNVVAAPVVTSAASGSGSILPLTPSETRMYAV